MGVTGLHCDTLAIFSIMASFSTNEAMVFRPIARRCTWLNKCHSWAFIGIVAVAVVVAVVVVVFDIASILEMLQESERLRRVFWVIIVPKNEAIAQLELQFLVAFIIGGEDEQARQELVVRCLLSRLSRHIDYLLLSAWWDVRRIQLLSNHLVANPLCVLSG